MAPRNKHPKWGGKQKKEIFDKNYPTELYEKPEEVLVPSRIGSRFIPKVPITAINRSLREKILKEYTPIEIMGSVVSKGWVEFKDERGDPYILRFNANQILRAAETLSRMVIPTIKEVSLASLDQYEKDKPGSLEGLSVQDLTKLLEQAQSLVTVIRNGNPETTPDANPQAPGRTGRIYKDSPTIVEAETSKDEPDPVCGISNDELSGSEFSSSDSQKA